VLSNANPPYLDPSSDVQLGQRVAAMEIAAMQNGHLL